MRWCLYLGLLAVALSMKLRVVLEAEETRCFYQILMAQQKYAVGLVPLQEGSYELNIQHQANGSWQHSVHRKRVKPSQNMSLFKITKQQALYSFCLSNLELYSLPFRLELRWGLELLDLRVVGEEEDQEAVVREARWIYKQADKIMEVVRGSFVKRQDRDEYANLMRKKLIGYAIVGLLVLVGITLAFYLSLRKTFHERKFI